MRIYNSLTKKVEDFEPLDSKTVRIYSCGPTVYDHIHIGNLAGFMAADTLRRVLEANGYKVKHVMNLTDVDDKTIKASREKYPDLEPMDALRKLTDEYMEVFKADMAEIGNDISKLEFIRATDSIEAMKKLISDLHANGFAYIADDGVYFSIEKYKQSGKKYGQLLELTEQNTSSSRINNDEYDKSSVHDFALWKKQKDGEPSWSFELEGQDVTGRPGWHIECSAMSNLSLGQPFDIHTGGVDLIFPHHENEIAQSTALTADAIYSKVFAHNEHLLVDGKKMSKSLGNFYTLSDIKQKGFRPLAFRLMVLMGHYRSQLNFTEEGLRAAQNRLDELEAWADQVHQPSGAGVASNQVMDNVRSALSNDINTPEALAAFSGLVTSSEPGKSEGLKAVLSTLDACFGLGLSDRPDITEAQKQILKQRQEARDKSDWAKSDELRDQLRNEGLEVKDSTSGQIWSRLVNS